MSNIYRQNYVEKSVICLKSASMQDFIKDFTRCFSEVVDSNKLIFINLVIKTFNEEISFIKFQINELSNDELFFNDLDECYANQILKHNKQIKINMLQERIDYLEKLSNFV